MPFEINFSATEEELEARFGDAIIIHGDVESVNGKTGVVVLDADDVGAVPAGEYDPDAKTESMTQAVGVDEDGKLWTAPGGGGGGAVDSVNGQTGAVVLDADDVGAYELPSGGIPKTDLASDVQTSLEKADTALQSAPVTSVNGQTGAVTVSVPAASSATPQALSTAAAGSSGDYSRADHVHAKPTYSKSDVGLGNVDNVQQYSASNPPPYPVTSVNGSTGAVSLSIPSTAADVGAIAAPVSPTSGQFLKWNGSAWIADDLPVYNGGVS